MLTLNSVLDNAIIFRQRDEDIFNVDDYVPPGFHREPISPCDEARSRSVGAGLDYESGKSDSAVIQK